MKKIIFSVISIVLLFVTGCGPRVSTEKTTDKDLSRYDTFAYLPNTSAEVEGRSTNNEEVSRFIIQEVNDNLREAGYTLDRENPDLLVLVSTRSEMEAETMGSPRYATYPYTVGAPVSPNYSSYYYSGYRNVTNVAGYNTDTYAYEEGTVIINLVDRETRETVWKGIASEPIEGEPTVEAIADLVNDIFEEYPLNN